VARVDVHAHFVPEFYREALISAGQGRPDGIPAIPEWSEDAALRLMDQLDIETAVLSISSPGVHLGDPSAAIALSRRCNEEASRLKTRHSGRIGYFGCLPLPEIESSVAEAVRALDELDADGVVLLSNHRGAYLGDPRLDPLFEELNRRSAVVFLHPTSPCRPSGPLGYPAPLLEFMFDTTRSVVDLILSGRFDQLTDVRVVVPHAGAALPVLANRVELLAPIIGRPAQQPPKVVDALRKMYYDVAGAPVPHLLTALLQITDTSHLLYGSDFPFTPPVAVVRLAALLDETTALDDRARDALMSGNARTLLGAGAGAGRPPAAANALTNTAEAGRQDRAERSTA